MEIKYSKFDFSKNDIGFFLFFMIYIQPQLLFSKNIRDVLGGTLFLSIVILYFVYRFYLVWILKKKGEIKFCNELIEIKGVFFIKKLEYRNIRNLTIRKNYLGSYDIVINYDESINFFRYLNNYFFDKFSFRKNHDNSFVICDVKNMKEVLKYLLNKIGYSEYEISNETNKKKLYVKYSLFERAYLICWGILLVLWLFTFIFPQVITVVIVYLIITNVRVLKKEYIMIKYNNKIKIYEKNKIIYVIEDFYENDERLIIEYNNNQTLFSKYNFYYFSNNILPKNYKKEREK